MLHLIIYDCEHARAYLWFLN